MGQLERLQNEYVMHGGGLFTRQEVYDLESARSDLPERGIGSADWWAFHTEAVDVDAMPAEDFLTLRGIARSIQTGS